MNYQPEPLFSAVAEHGEGPVWDPESRSYYWVDLLKGTYFYGDPITGLFSEYNIGEALGVMALSSQGQPVMASANGFGIFDERENAYMLFDPSPESDREETRFNDGTVDVKGRFIAGTMTYDGGQPVGKLYRLNSDKSFKELDNGFRIPNGMGWNKSGSIFYLIDTLQFKMFAYDYDKETGDISKRRTFIQFEENDLADGMTIDSDGCFWIAFYGGAKVVKYDPNGDFMMQISFPVPYTTSCCFGGQNMNQLFVTTSLRDLDGKGLSKYPMSGRCFVVETDSRGIPDPRVILD